MILPGQCITFFFFFIYLHDNWCYVGGDGGILPRLHHPLVKWILRAFHFNSLCMLLEMISIKLEKSCLGLVVWCLIILNFNLLFITLVYKKKKT